MNVSEIVNSNDCRGCGVCSIMCPTKAIEIKLSERGFYYAYVDKEKCVDCSRCMDVCSVCDRDLGEKRVKNVYYAYDKNEARRIWSSSGGIVGALADAAIAGGYVVIGAAYDYETNRVKHIVVDSTEDYYKKISGSKYIPSYTADGFRVIKDYDKVMVIGTPCQIQALKAAYPDKDMLCVDFRCYGVCSQILWDKYVESIEKRYKGRKIVHINSRSKTCSWLKWGVEINFEDGTTYFAPKTKDAFGKIFSGMEYAGNHCLKCDLSGELSYADIRVEDGWQLSKFLKNEDYKKGASQVTVMTDRGVGLWTIASSSLHYENAGLENAMHGCNKHTPKPYLNELIMDPAVEIEEIIQKYKRTVPVGKRVFDYLCNFLFEVPVLYFAIKRIYRKIKRMDDGSISICKKIKRLLGYIKLVDNA